MIKSHLSVGQGRRILEWNCRAFCHVPQSLAPQHCAPLGRVSPKQISKSIYPPGTNANRCMKRPCGAHSLTLRSVPISFSVGCLLEAGLAKAAGKHFVGTRWPASLLTAIPAAISVFQEVHCYPPCTIARIGTTLLYTDFSVRAQMKYWWLGCLCRFLLTTFLRHIRNSTVVMLSLQFILPCALRTRATSLPGLLSSCSPTTPRPALQLTGHDSWETNYSTVTTAQVYVGPSVQYRICFRSCSCPAYIEHGIWSGVASFLI
jgi:hypothetical protein